MFFLFDYFSANNFLILKVGNKLAKKSFEVVFFSIYFLNRKHLNKQLTIGLKNAKNKELLNKQVELIK